MTGRYLDWHGAGSYFHCRKDTASILAQPAIVHQRLPHLPRSNLSVNPKHPIPGHVSANVRARGGYVRS